MVSYLANMLHLKKKKKKELEYKNTTFVATTIEIKALLI